jgi:hypothetical protein
VNQSTDLDIFFYDFGTSATIAEPAKADKTTSVLFDATTISEMGVLTDKPQITIKESDLSGFDLKAATITISGTEYRMMKPLVNGQGLTTTTLIRI